MEHRIFIGRDDVGDFVCDVRGSEAPPTPGVRWELVAATQSDLEAARIMALLSRRHRREEETPALTARTMRVVAAEGA
jgi:hypothetical protein